jgi:hypothetical protein
MMASTGGDIYMKMDWAIGQLEWTIGLLDPHIAEINKSIAAAGRNTNEGLFDHGEFLLGTGFTGIQRYMTAIRSWPNFNRAHFSHNQLQCGPQLFDGVYFAEALNAIANFWKHQDEWWHMADGMEHRKNGNNLAEKTQDFVEKVFAAHHGLDVTSASEDEINEVLSPMYEYVCSNMMAIMVKDAPSLLSSLVPQVLAWRDALESTSPYMR